MKEQKLSGLKQKEAEVTTIQTTTKPTGKKILRQAGVIANKLGKTSNK